MSIAKQLREKMGVDKLPDQIDLQIQYSHTDTHLVLMFSQKIDNLTMSLEQCDEMIKTLDEVREVFIKYKRGKK